MYIQKSVLITGPIISMEDVAEGKHQSEKRPEN